MDFHPDLSAAAARLSAAVAVADLFPTARPADRPGLTDRLSAHFEAHLLAYWNDATRRELAAEVRPTAGRTEVVT